MKKILMGLVALTSTSFANIDLSNPQAGTNIFEFGGQEGKIKISAKIKSQLTPIKYVIFVDDNGTWDGTEEDTLTLPDILLSQAPVGNKFETAIDKKVYVKAVNAGNNGVEDIGSGKNVEFTVVLDQGYTGITSTSFRNGGELTIQPTALMAKGSLEALVSSASATVNTSGLIEKDSKFYRTPNAVRFFSSANGVLEVGMKSDSSFSGGDTMDFTTAAEIQNLFTVGQAFNAVKIKATVN